MKILTPKCICTAVLLLLAILLPSISMAEKKEGMVNNVWPEYRQLTIDGTTYTVAPSVKFGSPLYANGVNGLRQLQAGDSVVFDIQNQGEDVFITTIKVRD